MQNVNFAKVIKESSSSTKNHLSVGVNQISRLRENQVFEFIINHIENLSRLYNWVNLIILIYKNWGSFDILMLLPVELSSQFIPNYILQSRRSFSKLFIDRKKELDFCKYWMHFKQSTSVSYLSHFNNWSVQHHWKGFKKKKFIKLEIKFQI